jgi:hypothetical protein
VAGLLSLCFNTPDRDFEMAHLKSRNSPNLRSVECNHHRAAFGAAHPVWAGTVEELQRHCHINRKRSCLNEVHGLKADHAAFLAYVSCCQTSKAKERIIRSLRAVSRWRRGRKWP